jgi:hypothetical protein
VRRVAIIATETPDADLRAQLAPIIDEPGWVIDGTYQRKPARGYPVVRLRTPGEVDAFLHRPV